MDAACKTRLPVLIIFAAIASLGCSCKSKRSAPRSGQTVFIASDANAAAAAEEVGEETGAAAAPAEDPELRARLEEAMKQTGFAAFGPAASVVLEPDFHTASKRYLQGPGSCYAVLAACSVDGGQVELRVLDERKSEVTLMPCGEGKIDPEDVAAGLACPSVGGMHSIQIKSKAGGGQCSVAVMGD
jgi:hypothetical protein